MMGQDWGFGWGGMWFGWLMMIGFIVALVVLVDWLVRLSMPGASIGAGSTENNQRAQTALDTLQARYARGEISKEEYLDVRATLLGT